MLVTNVQEARENQETQNMHEEILRDRSYEGEGGGGGGNGIGSSVGMGDDDGDHALIDEEGQNKEGSLSSVVSLPMKISQDTTEQTATSTPTYPGRNSSPRSGLSVEGDKSTTPSASPFSAKEESSARKRKDERGIDDTNCNNYRSGVGGNDDGVVVANVNSHVRADSGIIKEEGLDRALRFLDHPNIADVPLSKKLEYLRDVGGLTQEETYAVRKIREKQNDDNGDSCGRGDSTADNGGEEEKKDGDERAVLVRKGKYTEAKASADCKSRRGGGDGDGCHWKVQSKTSQSPSKAVDDYERVVQSRIPGSGEESTGERHEKKNERHFEEGTGERKQPPTLAFSRSGHHQRQEALMDEAQSHHHHHPLHNYYPYARYYDDYPPTMRTWPAGMGHHHQPHPMYYDYAVRNPYDRHHSVPFPRHEPPLRLSALPYPRDERVEMTRREQNTPGGETWRVGSRKSQREASRIRDPTSAVHNSTVELLGSDGRHDRTSHIHPKAEAAAAVAGVVSSSSSNGESSSAAVVSTVAYTMAGVAGGAWIGVVALAAWRWLNGGDFELSPAPSLSESTLGTTTPDLPLRRSASLDAEDCGETAAATASAGGERGGGGSIDDRADEKANYFGAKEEKGGDGGEEGGLTRHDDAGEDDGNVGKEKFDVHVDGRQTLPITNTRLTYGNRINASRGDRDSELGLAFVGEEIRRLTESIKDLRDYHEKVLSDEETARRHTEGRELTSSAMDLLRKSKKNVGGGSSSNDHLGCSGGDDEDDGQDARSNSVRVSPVLSSSTVLAVQQQVAEVKVELSSIRQLLLLTLQGQPSKSCRREFDPAKQDRNNDQDHDVAEKRHLNMITNKIELATQHLAKIEARFSPFAATGEKGPPCEVPFACSDVPQKNELVQRKAVSREEQKEEKDNGNTTAAAGIDDFNAGGGSVGEKALSGSTTTFAEPAMFPPVKRLFPDTAAGVVRDDEARASAEELVSSIPQAQTQLHQNQPYKESVQMDEGEASEFSSVCPANANESACSAETFTVNNNDKEVDEAPALIKAMNVLVDENRDDEKSLEAGIQVINMYINKLLQNPDVPRYRKINTLNPTYTRTVASLVGAKEFLLEVGFEEKTPEGTVLEFQIHRGDGAHGGDGTRTHSVLLDDEDGTVVVRQARDLLANWKVNRKRGRGERSIESNASVATTPAETAAIWSIAPPPPPPPPSASNKNAIATESTVADDCGEDVVKCEVMAKSNESHPRHHHRRNAAPLRSVQNLSSSKTTEAMTPLPAGASSLISPPVTNKKHHFLTDEDNGKFYAVAAAREGKHKEIRVDETGPTSVEDKQREEDETQQRGRILRVCEEEEEEKEGSVRENDKNTK